MDCTEGLGGSVDLEHLQDTRPAAHTAELAAVVHRSGAVHCMAGAVAVFGLADSKLDRSVNVKDGSAVHLRPYTVAAAAEVVQSVLPDLMGGDLGDRRG